MGVSSYSFSSFRAYRFSGTQLLSIHTEFTHSPVEANPARNRMDPFRRCCVAYLFQIERARSNATAFVFYPPLADPRRWCNSKRLPIGRIAAWCLPCIYALARRNKGPCLHHTTRAEVCIAHICPWCLPIGCTSRLAGLARGSRKAFCRPRQRLRVSAARWCLPSAVRWGGAPWKFAIAMRLFPPIRGRGNVSGATPIGPVQFASNIIAYLQFRIDNESMRPEAAARSYSNDSDARRRSETMGDIWGYRLLQCDSVQKDRLLPD